MTQSAEKDNWIPLRMKIDKEKISLEPHQEAAQWIPYQREVLKEKFDHLLSFYKQKGKIQRVENRTIKLVKTGSCKFTFYQGKENYFFLKIIEESGLERFFINTKKVK